jgi:hypothetical protein
VEFTHNLYPKRIKYLPTPIRVTRAFCLMWSAWSVTKICAKNVLSIIQRQSERLALFVWCGVHACMECTQNLYPKCITYHPTPIGATRLYPKCIKYHPTPIGATRAFRLMWSAWSLYPKCIKCRIQRQSEGLVCTQNVLSIIQRRSDITVVECTQKCIIYHPTPNGVNPKFVPKLY